MDLILTGIEENIMKILGIDLSEIANLVTKYDKAVSDKQVEAERLQRMLNNVDKAAPLTDITQKRNVSPRVAEKEVQIAIENFNRLLPEVKNDILEMADKELQDRLMRFIEFSSNFAEENESKQYCMSKLISELNNELTQEKLSQLKQDFDRIVNSGIEDANNVIDAFNAYRGTNYPEEAKVSLSDPANYALNKSGRFKQTMDSYRTLVHSKLKTYASTDSETQKSLISDLQQTLERIQAEIYKYHTDAVDLMTPYIPKAVQAENQFSASKGRYINDELPKDLNLENKVCENVLIDTILSFLNYQGTALY